MLTLRPVLSKLSAHSTQSILIRFLILGSRKKSPGEGVKVQIGRDCRIRSQESLVEDVNEGGRKELC